ncbi:MAG TPA: hypothetical protein VG184_01945 [Acidimicrobiales bacterium]|jgi:hypothetical protein|nr:hypothetical protein [Acidimicrobiales bacterium]
MSYPVFLATRAVFGGLLVVAFAVLGEVVKPKRFAGLFGAAPSVALANLALVVAVQGTAKAAVESRGMIGGAVAMIAACSAGVVAVRRLHALKGAGVMAMTWLAVAAVIRALVY